jgi:hypothetical protein
MAANLSMPIMPRLETQKVPPANSDGVSFFSLALLPRALASALIAKSDFRCASRITGVMRPSSIATANDTCAAEWCRIAEFSHEQLTAGTLRSASAEAFRIKSLTESLTPSFSRAVFSCSRRSSMGEASISMSR